jgi:hypothetical protein
MKSQGRNKCKKHRKYSTRTGTDRNAAMRLDTMVGESTDLTERSVIIANVVLVLSMIIIPVLLLGSLIKTVIDLYMGA